MKSLALGVFSSGLILSGLLVITSLKPINAIISLILAFLNGIGLFILLGEDFIGLLYCIIYIGAIVILFLFVIMLLNIQRENLMASLAFFKATKPMALLIGGLFLLVFSKLFSNLREAYFLPQALSLDLARGYPFFIKSINSNLSYTAPLESFREAMKNPEMGSYVGALPSYYLNTVAGSTAHSTVPTLNLKSTFAPIEAPKALSNIGEMLYKEWGYEMLLVLSLILLVGMIGAIVLTFHTRVSVKKTQS